MEASDHNHNINPSLLAVSLSFHGGPPSPVILQVLPPFAVGHTFLPATQHPPSGWNSKPKCAVTTCSKVAGTAGCTNKMCKPCCQAVPQPCHYKPHNNGLRATYTTDQPYSLARPLPTVPLQPPPTPTPILPTPALMPTQLPSAALPLDTVTTSSSSADILQQELNVGSSADACAVQQESNGHFWKLADPALVADWQRNRQAREERSRADKILWQITAAYEILNIAVCMALTTTTKTHKSSTQNPQTSDSNISMVSGSIHKRFAALAFWDHFLGSCTKISMYFAYFPFQIFAVLDFARPWLQTWISLREWLWPL